MSINLKQHCDGELIITDTSDYSNIPFSYEDTITINVLVLEKKDNPSLTAITFNTHTTSALDEVHLQLGEDGLYNLIHIIVPTYEWYVRNKKLGTLSKYKQIFVSDGKNLLKITDDGIEQFDPIELVAHYDIYRTTIYGCQEFFFSTCFLYKCYINLCQMILNYNNPYEKSELGSKTLLDLVKCGDIDEQLKDYIFRRDFVWATINVINYLVKDKRLEEAEEILEEIQSCRGICYGTDVSPKSPQGRRPSTCGCNR